MSKNKINSLAALKQEKKKLEILEQAIRTEIVRSSNAAIDKTKSEFSSTVGSTTNWVQLGLAGYSLYNSLSNKDQTDQVVDRIVGGVNHTVDNMVGAVQGVGDAVDKMADRIPRPQQGSISDWLEIASDVAKFIEKR